MKIAVACEGSNITEHFGHCESFVLFNTDGKSITSKEVVQNPGHKPGFLPVFLAEKGVNVIISGGMGGGAVEIFNEKGIKVITGVSGDAETAVKSYINGTLVYSGTICDHKH